MAANEDAGEHPPGSSLPLEAEGGEHGGGE
jgi:hypothetical protein